MHVSPQRFNLIAIAGAGPAGIRVGVLGAPGENILLTAIDANGVVRTARVLVPGNGTVIIDL